MWSFVAGASGTGAALELGIERVAQRVGEEREGGHEDRHRRAGGEQLPPLAEDQLVLRLVEHRAPRDDVDGHAEAEERQDHLVLDERDDEDRQLHEHDVRHVREDVHEHAAPVRGTDRVGGLHVLARLVLQVLGADEAEHAGPAGQAEDQDDRHRALLLQHRGDREDQQHVGNRAEHAVEPVEEVVHPAAVVARERAEERAEERRHERGRDADEDRRLRSLDRLLEHVAAPLVAAERERRAPLFRRRLRALALADVGHHVGERIDALLLVRNGCGRRSGRRRGAFLSLELGDHVSDRIDDARFELARRTRGRRGRTRCGGGRRGGRPAFAGRPRRGRVVDADFARPVARDETGARQDHHHDEQQHDGERHHADGVGAQAPPAKGPQPRGDGMGNFARRTGSAGAQGREVGGHGVPT